MFELKVFIMSISNINLVPIVAFGGAIASVACIGVATAVTAKVALVASTIFFFGAFGGFCRCYYAK